MAAPAPILDDARPDSSAEGAARPHRLYARTNPFTGEIDGCDFEAPTRFDKLFTGLVVRAPQWADLQDLVGDAGRGLEEIGPEDTGMRITGACSDRRPVTC